MRVFTCKEFEGFYPVGTAAVVVADSREAAAAALELELRQNHVPQNVPVEWMVEVDPSKPSVIVLRNGDY